MASIRRGIPRRDTVAGDYAPVTGEQSGTVEPDEWAGADGSASVVIESLVAAYALGLSEAGFLAELRAGRIRAAVENGAGDAVGGRRATLRHGNTEVHLVLDAVDGRVLDVARRRLRQAT